MLGEDHIDDGDGVRHLRYSGDRPKGGFDHGNVSAEGDVGERPDDAAEGAEDLGGAWGDAGERVDEVIDWPVERRGGQRPQACVRCQRDRGLSDHGDGGGL